MTTWGPFCRLLPRARWPQQVHCLQIGVSPCSPPAPRRTSLPVFPGSDPLGKLGASDLPSGSSVPPAAADPGDCDTRAASPGVGAVSGRGPPKTPVCPWRRCAVWGDLSLLVSDAPGHPLLFTGGADGCPLPLDLQPDLQKRDFCVRLRGRG